MGAVTALYYMKSLTKKSRKKIMGLILDSPFSDLEKISLKFCNAKYGIPEILIKFGISMIMDSIRKKIDIDVSKIKPIEFIY